MKLKKLLAAVTAAALAVTTMAVTSFTASAADEPTWTQASKNVTATTLTATYTVTGSTALPDNEYNAVCPKSTKIDIVSLIGGEVTKADIRNIKVVVSADGPAGAMVGATKKLKDDPYFDSIYENFDITDGTTGTYTLSTPSGITEDNAFELGVHWMNINTTITADITVTYEAPVETGTWIKKSAGVYYFKAEAAPENATDADYAAGATKPIPLKIPYDEILAAGKTVADVKSVTAAVECSDTSGCLYGIISGEAVKPQWGGANPKTVTYENADDFADVEFQIWYAQFGDTCTVTFSLEYKEDEETGEFEIYIDPDTKLIAVGEDFQVTVLVTGTTPELENVMGTMTATNSDETVVELSEGTDTEDGMVYTVTGLAAGTATLDFEWVPDDMELEGQLIASCEVTVTEEGGDTPPASPAATETLWEGSMAIGWDGDVNMLQLESDKFANIAAGGSLKFTFTGTGEAPQLKFLDGDWQELVSVQSDPNYTEYGTIALSGTSFSFTISAADAATLKVKGFKAGGQDCTVTKVEYIPEQGGNTPTPPPVVDPTPDDPTPDDPAHTHTPATAWTSDATGHWHACSGCTDKVEFAAHTSDEGTITTAATATTAGTKTFKCTVCGYVIKTEPIPATGTSDTPTPAPTPTTGEPVHSYTGAPVVPTWLTSGAGSNTPAISGDNGKSGWDAIGEEALAAPDGTKIEIDMNGTTRVPSSIFKNIKDKDIDIVFNMGRGVKWTVNGLSVTKAKTIDFDFSKSTRHIPDELVDAAEGSYKKQLSLDHNGSFGFAAVMTYDIGTKYNGSYANLFYYNPKSKELELIYCSPISGGKANFVFNHASYYLITVTDEPLGEFEDVSAAAGISSDSADVNAAAFAAVLAVITAAFGAVVYKKRRHN